VSAKAVEAANVLAFISISPPIERAPYWTPMATIMRVVLYRVFADRRRDYCNLLPSGFAACHRHRRKENPVHDDPIGEDSNR
jgi:hypothetical protein